MSGIVHACVPPAASGAVLHFGAVGRPDDSDLSSINGRPFSDAAGWLETKFHAICRGHEQECSFKTILHDIENAYDLKVSRTWKRRLKEKMRELNDTEAEPLPKY